MTDNEAPDNEAQDKFASLLRKLVRVPKAEIDDKEREYRESKEDRSPVKAGEMLGAQPKA
jgi:hypothetical protein